MLIGAHVSPAGGLPKAIERGVEFSAPKGWLDDADAVGLAEQLYRDVSRSLRVFASTDADGWQCRTWLESPSVR